MMPSSVVHGYDTVFPDHIYTKYLLPYSKVFSFYFSFILELENHSILKLHMLAGYIFHFRSEK